MLPVRRVEPNGLDRRSSPGDAAEPDRSSDDHEIDGRDDDKAYRKQQATRMTWRIAVVLLLAVGMPVIRLALDSGRSHRSSSSSFVSSSLTSTSNEPPHSSAVNAVAFIVAGDLTTGPGAALAVEALRGKGQWDGPIVLLTDRPTYLTHLTDSNWTPWKCNSRSLAEETVASLHQSNQQFTSSNLHALSTSSTSSSSSNHHGSSANDNNNNGNAILHVVTVPSLQGRGPGDSQWLLAVKALKTRLFDVITDDQVGCTN